MKPIKNLDAKIIVSSWILILILVGFIVKKTGLSWVDVPVIMGFLITCLLSAIAAGLALTAITKELTGNKKARITKGLKAIKA